LPFWPARDSWPNDDVVNFDWSGCGDLYKVFVKSMAVPGLHNGLKPDLVFEFDERGKIIDRWFIPGNYVVSGVQGGELLVWYYPVPIFRSPSVRFDEFPNTYLKIAANGELGVVVKQDLPDRTHTGCPHIKEFEGLAFTRCAVFKDLVSGLPRRLAYQGPCT
jgi:hypothetical protein